MRKKPFIVIALLLAGIASLTLFGIVGIGRGGGRQNFDGAVLWAAGRCWLDHGNPYDHEQLAGDAHGAVNLAKILFFYPPQAAAVCVGLGLLKYPMARLVWLGTNLICILAIVAMSGRQLRRRDRSDRIGPWIMAAIIIGNPFSTHVVWMGQTSLLAVAGTIAACEFAPYWAFAGFCLGVASFKPQICVLLGVWFLLEKRWKLLLAALVTAVVLSAYPICVQGPIGMFKAWHSAIQLSYSSLVYNAPGSPHKVGLDSLLQAAGVKVSSAAVAGVGVLGTGLAWLLRRKWNREDLMAILMGLTFVFVGYSHDYDYVGLIPMLVSLWFYCHRSVGWGIVGIALTGLLFGPQRLVRGEGNAVLDQWRTVVIFAMWVVIIFRSGSRRSRDLAA
jgi:hypothetical protein